MKFKIGDRVVCIRENPYVPVGARGTVAEDCDVPYVDWDNRYGRWALCEWRLELESHVTPHKPKYIPGQSLHTAAEVMQALLDGEKVTRAIWQGSQCYVHLINGHICTASGVSASPEYITNHDAVIYTPPKRKVKSERWFAVFKDTSGLSWSIPYLTEERAKEMYPNALDYVRAECVVELNSAPGEVEVEK